jgi:peptide-methionine (R)-S-oxide reductase
LTAIIRTLWDRTAASQPQKEKGKMRSRRAFLLAGTAATVGVAMGWRRSQADPAPAGTFEVSHTEEEWRHLLTPAQFRVLREQGTEAPWTSPLDHESRPGTYTCAGCALPLFDARTKFDSGTGWPSFWQPLSHAIATTSDRSFLMERTEVHCIRCGGHLGHVFDDGPRPTGLRYCMNGAAMTFTVL